MSHRLRVAVCPDFREERWPSMDRVADELLRALAIEARGRLQVESLLPVFRRRAGRIADGRLAANLDRGLNRLVDYPAHVAAARRAFDVFHIVDHSYAQLVHRLPPHRTVVTCHDLETFRCLLAPHEDPRSPWFRAMTRHILDGLAAAAMITCDTEAVRADLAAAAVTSPERLVVVPIGVSPAFMATPAAEADAAAARLLPAVPGAVNLIHVGSVVARKRVDVLLDVCAGLVAEVPGVRLIRVGGPFTSEQRRQVQALGLGERIVEVPPVDDGTLSALYRRSALALLPSAREGFGLPVVEALASGTPVVASHVPVLAEVAGPAAAFAPVGDVAAWTRTVRALLDERRTEPARWAARRAQGVEWASRYSWSRFAASLTRIYLDVAASAQRDGWSADADNRAWRERKVA